LIPTVLITKLETYHAKPSNYCHDVAHVYHENLESSISKSFTSKHLNVVLFRRRVLANLLSLHDDDWYTVLYYGETICTSNA